MIDVCLLGTGGMMPLENRWLTACWIEYEGSAILIDCGEGTQIAARAADCKLSRLDTLLVTHLHADHIAGLPGLLLTLGNAGKTTPLNIYGVAGTKRVVDALSVIAPGLEYEVNVTELPKTCDSFKAGRLQVAYMPVKHRVPCMAYRVTLKRPPVFNPEKAAALDIPKPMYKILHSGNEITLDDGRTVTPDEVLDGARDPLSVCYCTDTLYFDELADFAYGSDLLISEGMYGTEDMREKITDKRHMLFSDSAKIARDAQVKKLWLTHYSPALIRPSENIADARKIFPNTVCAYDGIKAEL